MTFGSLFSGVGGFDLGLERVGMEPAWTVEYDKQARSVLRKQWPDVLHYEDVHNVGPSQLTPVDLICGGFPCQDYSVAGKRGGLVGDRGALWWQMHRIIAECRPEWVVGENVPGLLSSNGGRDFLTIVASLVELGYGVTWATLDSRHFGVAQRRRRLFIVGHLGGIPRPEILALSEGLHGHPAPSREAGQGIAPSVTAGAPCARTGNERVEAEAFVIGFDHKASASRSMNPSEVSPALETTKGGAAIAFNTSQVTHPTNRRNPQPGDPCHTLVSGDHAPLVTGLHNTAILRRLTPTECERLQGFPDDWTRYADDGTEMADGPRYRMMGNAVTVNVAEWIAHRIMKATV